MSHNLLNETPDARSFIEHVRKNIDQFRLFEDETFARVDGAIIATTGTDLHGDEIAHEGLKAFVSNAKDELIWGGVEHNPLIQAVGRTLAMKYFRSPVSGTGFIAGVLGTYGQDYYLRFRDVGIDISKWSPDLCDTYDMSCVLEAAIAFNPQELPSPLIAEMLAAAPSFVEKDARIQFRKAAESLPILSVLIGTGLVLAGRKFAERTGEKLADANAELFSWLRKVVFKKIAQLTAKRVVIQFQTSHERCRISCAILSNDPDVLSDAVASLSEAVSAALWIIRVLAKFEVATITFEYD
jgi:hypothetical protein